MFATNSRGDPILGTEAGGLPACTARDAGDLRCPERKRVCAIGTWHRCLVGKDEAAMPSEFVGQFAFPFRRPVAAEALLSGTEEVHSPR